LKYERRTLNGSKDERPTSNVERPITPRREMKNKERVKQSCELFVVRYCNSDFSQKKETRKIEKDESTKRTGKEDSGKTLCERRLTTIN